MATRPWLLKMSVLCFGSCLWSLWRRLFAKWIQWGLAPRFLPLDGWATFSPACWGSNVICHAFHLLPARKKGRKYLGKFLSSIVGGRDCCCCRVIFIHKENPKSYGISATETCVTLGFVHHSSGGLRWGILYLTLGRMISALFMQNRYFENPQVIPENTVPPPEMVGMITTIAVKVNPEREDSETRTVSFFFFFQFCFVFIPVFCTGWRKTMSYTDFLRIFLVYLRGFFSKHWRRFKVAHVCVPARASLILWAALKCWTALLLTVGAEIKW